MLLELQQGPIDWFVCDLPWHRGFWSDRFVWSRKILEDMAHYQLQLRKFPLLIINLFAKSFAAQQQFIQILERAITKFYSQAFYVWQQF